jgi:hypothetical protein
MSRNDNNVTCWQLWREAASEDTLLTEYVPADLSAAVRAKMINVKSTPMIGVRFFGLGAENAACEVLISGWMDRDKPGMGQRLCNLTITLGAKVFTADQQLASGGSEEKWREADTIAIVANYGVGPNDVAPYIVGDSASLQNMIILPTFGYSQLLAEIRNLDGDGEPTDMAIIWRPMPQNAIVFTETFGK